MKDKAKNHPTGLSLLLVTLVVAIGNRLGLDISDDTALTLVVAIGVIVSALSPRFKKRWGGVIENSSPSLDCIASNLSDEGPQSLR